MEKITLRICKKENCDKWIDLNKQFMEYELANTDFWNNTNTRDNEVFRRTFEDAMNSPDLITLFMIEADGLVIGFANCMTIFSVWAHGKALILDDMFLIESARGKGYGKRVMNLIEEYAKGQGYKRIQFQSEESNPQAHLFYKSLGYDFEHMNFYVRYFDN
jgi:GNAT superfamily N-acetyltransferase